MPLLVILFGVYVVVGVVVAIVVPLLNLSKKRTSFAGFLGDIAALHIIGIAIFVALWPLWLALMVFGSDEEEKPDAAEGAAKSKPATNFPDEKSA